MCSLMQMREVCVRRCDRMYERRQAERVGSV